MALRDDIADFAQDVIETEYEITDAYQVPFRSGVTFGPTARKLFARVVYIDLRGSTRLLTEGDQLISLRAHKAFLYAVARCMRAEGGEPRGFAGDSVLGFFPGRDKDVACRAVRAAMKIRSAIDDVINPILVNELGHILDYGIGIGQGDVLVGKSGMSGEEDFQDLVWIGYAVYRAVEFGQRASKPSALWISEHVRKSINHDSSLTHDDDEPMWEKAVEPLPSAKVTVYKTAYRWGI
jgi:class 3 adenylate cyclase